MNRLRESASLYLRQHAKNPVHWQPWDDTALAQARKLDRPILLSIGYSACHWCHVMAHESFEDEVIGTLMNKLFVNIKVDREERPDLDKVYQLAHQLLAGRGGGWPLTVFLDPRDLTPFFAGTYFPPVPSHGMPAFNDVLVKLRAWFDSNRDEIAAHNQNLNNAIASIQHPGAGTGLPDEAIFSNAQERLFSQLDPVNGGFGGAPKFPQAPLLAMLPSLGRRTGDAKVHEALYLTLEKMSHGGLRDHLDGGFFRYTVDGTWTIPHFEKMLYDNAQLLPLYAEAARTNGSAWLREVTQGIAAWMVDELRLPNGGFSSSMDADADGQEGGFHVWQKNEVEQLLDADEFKVACQAFGLDQAPNFEGQAWHLTRQSGDFDKAGLTRSVEKLLSARARRIPPATDRKQLTSWNALCVEGFARAGAALNREDWLDTAGQTLAFIKDTAWQDGQLFAVQADGRVLYPAYLDDHAYLLHASVVMLQVRWKPVWLQFAIELADVMLERFADPENGGFYFSDKTQEVPMHRLRIMQDDATPSGNGIAALALFKLGHLLGESLYLEAAEGVLESSRAELEKYPMGHASLLQALDEYIDPAIHVVVTGRNPDDLRSWKQFAESVDRLNCYAFDPEAAELPGLPGRYPVADATTAYVCKGRRCLPAIDRFEDLEKQIKSMS